MTLDDRDEIYAYLDLVVLPRLRGEEGHLIRMWTEVVRAVRDLGVELPFYIYCSDDDMTKLIRLVGFYIESRGLNNG